MDVEENDSKKTKDSENNVENDDNDNDNDKDNENDDADDGIIDYYGRIFDFYFDILFYGKGTKSKTPSNKEKTSSNKENYPFILAILSKIEQAYDVLNPNSRGHKYLVQIAMQRLRHRYKAEEWEEFTEDIALPTTLFDIAPQTMKSIASTSSNMNTSISPRRFKNVLSTGDGESVSLSIGMKPKHFQGSSNRYRSRERKRKPLPIDNVAITVSSPSSADLKHPANATIHLKNKSRISKFRQDQSSKITNDDNENKNSENDIVQDLNVEFQADSPQKPSKPTENVSIASTAAIAPNDDTNGNKINQKEPDSVIGITSLQELSGDEGDDDDDNNKKQEKNIQTTASSKKKKISQRQKTTRNKRRFNDQKNKDNNNDNQNEPDFKRRKVTRSMTQRQLKKKY